MYRVKVVIALLVFSISITSSCLNAYARSAAPEVVLTFPAGGDADVSANQKVEVTFSKQINRLTINRRTFTLKEEGSNKHLLGRMNYSKKNKRVSFQPRRPLTSNTQYTFKIKGIDSSGSKLRDLQNRAMKNDYIWSFTTGSNSSADSTAPMVNFTSPLNASTNVSINSKVTATFNEVIDSNTIEFNLEQGGTPVSGVVSYFDKTAIFTPRDNLEINTTYTATITTQVKDLAGNALANNYVWSFTTSQTLDTLAPTVQLVSPANGFTNVAINRNFSADFNEALNPSTINTTTFILQQGSTLISGAVTYSGVTATFHPISNLTANLTYKATITTQVKDLAGNTLANNYVWSFTTSQVLDTLAPVVQLVSPSNGSTSIALNRSLSVDFSEALDPLTVSSTTFILAQGTTLIPSGINYSGTTATLDPTSNLAANSTYIATITTQVKDLAGNALANNYVWHFTTGQTQNEPVVLQSTSNFAILAGSTVTNTGPTSAQAKLDLTAAYNDAAGRTLAPVTVSGNMGGQTLTSGLYKSTSTLAISAGDLTLDAQGDANAVFIFQVASGFTVTSGRQVILSGGALASNVYWQVGTSATIGTNAIFKGNILADQSITFETGATLDGRALTRIGAVSLDSNTITKL